MLVKYTNCKVVGTVSKGEVESLMKASQSKKKTIKETKSEKK